jgi:DNA adenine methylase
LTKNDIDQGQKKLHEQKKTKVFLEIKNFYIMVCGRYFGAKSKLAREIVSFILSYFDTDEYDAIIDCFCGTGSISIQFKKQSDKIVMASDKLKCMITTLQAVQNGYIPPSTTTKAEYDKVRFEDDNPLKSFLHILCNRSGRIAEREFHEAMERELLKMPRKTFKRAIDLQGIQFYECDYKDWTYVKGALIYCDPPYINNFKTWPKNYKGFDHKEFWEWCRIMSANNIVIISEYSAPSDFKEIWSKTFINYNYKSTKLVTEKLFIYAN